MTAKGIPYYCALCVQSHLNVSTTIITPCGSVVLFLPCFMLWNNLPRSGRRSLEGTSGNQERSICSVLQSRTEEAGIKCFSLESSDFSSHITLLSSVLLKFLCSAHTSYCTLWESTAPRHALCFYYEITAQLS